MKNLTFLVFNKSGEISQKYTRSVTFDHKDFPEFKHYKRYDEHIILYNVELECKNLTKFYFTQDVYTSDVALLKVRENEIKNYTYKMYVAKISKIKYEPNDYYSDSDSEIEDNDPFTY